MHYINIYLNEYILSITDMILHPIVLFLQKIAIALLFINYLLFYFKSSSVP